MIDETIRLKDGRRLGYASFGDQAGNPIVYCIGGVGSRLQAHPTSQQPLPPGIRLIAVERPGMGLSDYLPGRKIVDWPEDLVQLVDALRIASFSIAGVSSGGPYALACAYRIPERLNKCGLVASATPPGPGSSSQGFMRTMLWIYRTMPWLTRLWFWWQYARHVSKDDDQLEAILSKPLQIPEMFCETDRKLWSDPQMRRHDLLDHLEAFRQGTKGPAYEASLWGRPWGFELEEITFERIYLWHGENDLNSPIASVRAMAASLPHCNAHYYPNHGHSVGSFYWSEILETLSN